MSVGPSLAEKGPHVAAEAFQPIELRFHRAMHGFHVTVVGGATRGAGQPDGNQLAAAVQIGEVFDVRLEAAKRRPEAPFGSQSAHREPGLWVAPAVARLAQHARRTIAPAFKDK
jgi:hypothetical protein